MYAFRKGMNLLLPQLWVKRGIVGTVNQVKCNPSLEFDNKSNQRPFFYCWYDVIQYNLLYITWND